jgi:SAM-dependent methyltransferase
MTNVWFGDGVADDGEYRLCGDVQGKRVLELGLPVIAGGAASNAVTLAVAGAKSIAVDPSEVRIGAVRRAAEAAEVSVECHHGELADLGFVTSASIDLVLATHSLDHHDDLQRLLRQVHRVLKPHAAFVLALTHPVAAMFDHAGGPAVRRYGASGPGGARSIGELFMHAQRANFEIDVVHELWPLVRRDTLVPAVLLVRARKLGV